MEQASNRGPDHLTQNEDDEFSLLQIFSVILRQWRLILVVPMVLALITGILMLSKPRRYAAVLSFMPASENRPMIPTGAMGLARQFGVDIGGGSADQSPQFYVDLLRRPSTLRKAVETQYHLPSRNGQPRRGTLIDYYGLTDSKSMPAWHEAVRQLRGDVVASVNRQSGVIQLTVSALNPSRAEQIAQRLFDIVTEFNLGARQHRAEEEARFVGGQLERARGQLLAAETQLQNFLTRNRVFQNSPELMFQHDRLERNVSMRQEVYTSLLAAHEQSRIDALRDTPLLTVIDQPAGSAQPQARGTVLRVMLVFLFGVTVASILALILELNRARGAGRSDLSLAINEAWSDIRNPRRWFKPARQVRAAKL
jgi:uncharacterized protein involved in exopolysaccharide biosynthesis